MVGRGETRGFRNPGWWRRPRAVAEWLREAGPLWLMMSAALMGLGLWIAMSWRVGVFVAGLLMAIIGVLYELRDRAWRRQRRPATVSVPAPGPRLPTALQIPQALMQDDYVTLLERDQVRAQDSFALRIRAARAYAVDDHELEWDCRRCRQRAVTLVIHHPVWDGPFEGAGSGVVDVRVTPYCPRCEPVTIARAWAYGLEPSAQLFDAVTGGVAAGGHLAGIPLRLPWTGVGVIRLHTALWLRAPFHNLPMQVERAIPPPPAPKDQPHPWTVGGQPRLVLDLDHVKQPDDVPAGTVAIDVPGFDAPCEVCGRPLTDPIHAMSQQDHTPA